jgi:hypothetical protein
MERADEKYKTAKAFRVAITTRLKNLARTTGEPYPELYRRVAIDRFLARIDWSKWTAKGGYILQRRLPKARATKDIDLSTADTSFVIQDETAQTAALTAAFQETAKVETGDYFVFQVAVEKRLPGFGKGGIRCIVRCLLDGELFATFQLDAIIQDEVVFPPENIVGDTFLSFAGLKPLTLTVPVKEEVFAEKLHAYTLPQGEYPRKRYSRSGAALARRRRQGQAERSNSWCFLYSANSRCAWRAARSTRELAEDIC